MPRSSTVCSYTAPVVAGSRQRPTFTRVQWIWFSYGTAVEFGKTQPVTVSDFTFLGSKITADGDCSHEIEDACSLEGKL